MWGIVPYKMRHAPTKPKNPGRIPTGAAAPLALPMGELSPKVT